MRARDFLQLAHSLAAGSLEVEWRSAISRAYYGAFHVARTLLLQCGFSVPRGEQAHGFLWLRLANAGNTDVQEAGNDLQHLRHHRNRADYDLGFSLDQATAIAQVQEAEEIIRTLEDAVRQPTKKQITDAIKIYERKVLKTVTWHP